MRYTKYHIDLGYCTTTKYAHESAENKTTGEVYVSGLSMNRLGEYEDTGLTPTEISLLSNQEKELSIILEQYKLLGEYNRLCKLVEADREERVVMLPCKVGDTVWTNFAMAGWYFREKDRPYPAKVVFIGLNDSEDMGGGLINIDYEKRGNMMQFNFSDIGKTVFLSRAEAEAAL